MPTELLLALDQGTTSSRALLTDSGGTVLAMAQQELPAHYPQSGWVEQDPDDIFNGQLFAARAALEQAGVTAADVRAIGITNQRETTLIWDRVTGRPVSNALVWQDRRSAQIIERWRSEGLAELIRERTGLEPDAYFSAGKIRWLLENDPSLQQPASEGRLAFGTVDSWLLWRLTGGAVHATDVTNASRTMLYDTAQLSWSQELLEALDIPEALLPEVRPSVCMFGTIKAEHLGAELPILAVAGDQHAASFGQACFSPGMSKNTYGTGCFMLLNTGSERLVPGNGLIGTVAWQLPEQLLPGGTDYAVEGSVFTAGAVIQWLRDGLGLISTAAEVEELARTVPDNGDVYLVPAFTGLGAPHWDPHARGTLNGISRGTTAGHLARAALEGIALQVADVFGAFREQSGTQITELRVDGGAARSDLLLQLQADALGIPVVRTSRMESTAFGAAFMAGLGAGVWASLAELSQLWAAERVFEPQLAAVERDHWFERWNEAVSRSQHWLR